MYDALPASVLQSERCFPRSSRGFLHADQQTAPAACSSSHYTQHDANNLRFDDDFCQNRLVSCNRDVRAVPVDVVDSSLWLQSTRVNPNKYQRTTLLVMDNLEGQSAQVVLVPPSAGWWTELRIWQQLTNVHRNIFFIIVAYFYPSSIHLTLIVTVWPDFT